MRFLFSTHLSGVLYEHQKWWCIDAVSHRIFSKEDIKYIHPYSNLRTFLHFKNISFLKDNLRNDSHYISFQGCHHGCHRLRGLSLADAYAAILGSRSSRPRPQLLVSWDDWLPGMLMAHLLPESCDGRPSYCVCVPVSPLTRTLVILNMTHDSIGAHSSDRISPNYFFRDPICKRCHILQCSG